MMLLIAMIVIGVDQATKWLAGTWGWTSLNSGISFGLLGAWPAWALSGLLVVLLVSSWYMYQSIWRRIPFATGLFIGGAVSNVIDRVLWSGVRDWLPLPGTKLQNNLADYAIVIGLILVFTRSLLSDLTQKEST